MSLTVKIKDERLLGALRRFPEQLIPAVRRTLKTEATKTQRHARQHHRFTTRSGNLERSVQMAVMGDTSARVGLDVGIAPYGPRIHRGWGTWQEDPFVHEAADARDDEFQRSMSDVVDRALRKAGLK